MTMTEARKIRARGIAQEATATELMNYLTMYTPYHNKFECTNDTELEYNEIYQIIKEEIAKRLQA